MWSTYVKLPGLYLLLKAKFHYASWFGAGSKLVQRWFKPDSVMEFGFEPVCDHLQTSFEPASVMEFGFNCVDTCGTREYPTRGHAT